MELAVELAVAKQTINLLVSRHPCAVDAIIDKVEVVKSVTAVDLIPVILGTAGVIVLAILCLLILLLQ
jgi:hypothetical protein